MLLRTVTVIAALFALGGLGCRLIGLNLQTARLSALTMYAGLGLASAWALMDAARDTVSLGTAGVLAGTLALLVMSLPAWENGPPAYIMRHPRAQKRSPVMMVGSNVILALLALGVLTPAPEMLRRKVIEWWVRPIVTMTGKVESRKGEDVVLHVKGTKNACTECTYRGLQSFYSLADEQHDARQMRLDITEVGSTKPCGEYDIGSWRIWPVPPEAESVQMFVMHTCFGETFSTMIADVPLK